MHNIEIERKDYWITEQFGNIVEKLVSEMKRLGFDEKSMINVNPVKKTFFFQNACRGWIEEIGIVLDTVNLYMDITGYMENIGGGEATRIVHVPLDDNLSFDEGFHHIACMHTYVQEESSRDMQAHNWFDSSALREDRAHRHESKALSWENNKDYPLSEYMTLRAGHEKERAVWTSNCPE